jgi:hypothetical protein
MSNNLNNPRDYDAVLGGESPAPINSVVLGGIEGVKRRLSSQVVEHRISALSEALNYDAPGLVLVIQALNDDCQEIYLAAYNLLKDINKLNIKALLDKYLQQYYFIHFNGFYYSQNKSSDLYLFRFYQDGTVLAAYVPAYQLDIEKAATWFHKENNQVTYRGIYKIDYNSLTFSITNERNTIEFLAKIRMYGYKVAHSTNTEYSFIEIQDIK